MTMKKSIVLKIILGICGLIILLPGALSLLNPVGIAASHGAADISGDIALLNDYRASGGILFAAGILIVIGIFRPKMTFTSTVIAAFSYLSLGFGRVISIIADGMPDEKSLIIATVVELVLGIAVVTALFMFREKEETPAA